MLSRFEVLRPSAATLTSIRACSVACPISSVSFARINLASRERAKSCSLSRAGVKNVDLHVAALAGVMDDATRLCIEP